MKRFYIYLSAALIVIFGCLAFLFYVVLFNPLFRPPVTQEAGRVIDDLEGIYENQHVFIADREGGLTYQEYLSNLEYLQENLYNTFRSSTEVVSFIYYDIATGYTFSYNADVEFPTASSVKANLAIYIMDLVSQGKAYLSKKLTYTQELYNPGSGRIKNQPFGTQYTVGQLLESVMIDSDNIAYLMLLKEFGYRNAQRYWFDLGATTTYTRGTSWGTMTANDALIYMRRLWSFYRESPEYGVKLMNLFKRSNFRYVFHTYKTMEVAHKSGNTTAAMNDLAIVFDDHPFILVVLTRKNSFETSHMKFFAKASEDIWAFHKYFWANIGYKYIP